MNVSVPKEIVPGEHRVALVPDVAGKLGREGVSVRLEAGAGTPAGFPDDLYAAAGVEVQTDTSALWGSADAILKIHRPIQNADLGKNEVELMRKGAILIAVFQPLVNHDVVRSLARHNVTSFSLDLLPRITRAQPMDVLSAMSTVAGYKAVLMGAGALGKFFPMLVTAAGTLVPARVLVLGAGVAGLQAIATARRLGALVQAFDVRPAAREQVESLGARFLAPEEVSDEGEGAGGYAKQLSEEQHRRELELIAKSIKDVDVVVTTALIPGKPAPTLITRDMVESMRPGSVVVDLAAEAGGNCELSRAGETVAAYGVQILAPVNIPATLPLHASQMYSRNISTFLKHLLKDGEVVLDFDDEITRDTCVTHEGRIRSEAVAKAMEGGDRT